MLIVSGHTSNIGKAIYEYYPYSIGISRNNGCSINNTNQIVQYLKEAETKIFINNAYSDNAQSRLLLGIYEAKLDCRVINIGSISAYRTDAMTLNQIQYAADKLHLKSVHEHVRRNQFNSTLIELGTVDTSYNTMKDVPKLSLQQVIECVDFCIKNKNVDTIRLVA